MNRKLTLFAAALALGALSAAPHAQQNPTPQAKVESAERKPIYYRNPMGLPDISPVPKKDEMGMDYIPVYADEVPASGTRQPAVTISLDRVQRTGVRTEKAELRRLLRPVRAPGVVEIDERRISVVAPRFDGFIETVGPVTSGTHVKKGDLLLNVFGQELLNQAARLLVEQHVGKSMDESAPGIASGPAGLIGARRRLLNYGVPEEFINLVQRERKVPDTISWPAPRDGVVLERNAVDGQAFKAGDVLFRIADHSVVWLMADIPESDIGALKPGQPVKVTARAHPGRVFNGQVSVVYPHLMRETRTARVRIELPNPDLALLPDMYADVEIDVGAGEQPRLSVPNSAILDSGNAQVVLVARGEGRFEPRSVTPGLRGQDYTEVTSGIAAGDEVVVAANFLIDAESNLKAALAAFSADAASRPPTPPPASAAPPPDPHAAHGSHP